jgi:hypothetical protein
MSKSDTGANRKPSPIRRSLISETTRNIDSIASQINEGKYGDRDLMMKLINRMLAFLNEFIKPTSELKPGNGMGVPDVSDGQEGV